MNLVTRFHPRRLVFASLMGGLALVSNNLEILHILIYPPFKLNPRWIFSLLGACWTGPLGGLLCGLMGAIDMSPGFDIFVGSPLHALVGWVAKYLRKKKHSGVWACLLMLIIGIPGDTLTGYYLFDIPLNIAFLVVGITSITTIGITIFLGLILEKKIPYITQIAEI
ncbi:MAG: hypothetical protein QXO15_05480 [Nitrososphaerota archaeon]